MPHVLKGKPCPVIPAKQTIQKRTVNPNNPIHNMQTANKLRVMAEYEYETTGFAEQDAGSKKNK